MSRSPDERLGLDLVGRLDAAEAWRLLVPLPGTARPLRALPRPASRRGDGGRGHDLPGLGPAGERRGPPRHRGSPRGHAAEPRADLAREHREPQPAPRGGGAGACVGRDAPARRGGLAADGAARYLGGFEYAVFDDVPSSYHGPGLSNLVHPYPGGWTHPLALGMPWVSFVHPDGRALYIGDHDDRVTFSAFWIRARRPSALRTGTMAALGSSAQQRWPEEVLDPGASLNLAWVSFPFLAPGGRWKARRS